MYGDRACVGNTAIEKRTSSVVKNEHKRNNTL